MARMTEQVHDALGTHAVGDLLFALLGLAANGVSEAQQARITTENRLRALTDEHGLTDSTVFVVKARVTLARFESAESAAKSALAAVAREIPWLPAFIEARKGVSYPGVGMLLGVAGDPASRPNVAKFWQYCGHGDPERSKRTKDAVRREQDEDGKDIVILPFSPVAKTLTWRIADSAYRQGYYRPVYLAAREAALAKVHERPCVRCGREKGAAGTPWSAGHQHAHALRIVGKELLRELWLAATQDLPPARAVAEPMPPPPAAGHLHLAPSQDHFDAHAADAGGIS